MSYIKFRIKNRQTDDEGWLHHARIKRMESDMADVDTYELNLVMHALSARGRPVTIQEFLLDSGVMDNENWILG